MHGFVLAIVPAGRTPEVQASLTEILPKANSLLLPRSFASPRSSKYARPGHSRLMLTWALGLRGSRGLGFYRFQS